MTVAWLCDFDGTVAPHDMGEELGRPFGRGDSGELERALERWQAGEIGHRELTRVECARLRVTEPQALAFTSRFGLDAAFGDFVSEVTTLGHTVEVVSEGFEFYIADLLTRAGLGRLPFTSNRLRFEDGGVTRPEFPHDGGCGRCGNCKGARVAEHQRLGRSVVMVGDGLSDRCGARAADLVLARGGLLDWCRDEGIGAEAFRDFSDVARRARGLAADRAAGSRR